MHMLSRKDLHSAELDILQASRNPATVGTAIGEVQTNEEATVYVNDLDLFLTVKIIEDTPSVVSLGKLCEDHGYSNGWASGQKPHLLKKRQKTMYRSLSKDYQPRSSISTASTSPTSLTKDSTEDSSSSPATIRHRSTSSPPQ